MEIARATSMTPTASPPGCRGADRDGSLAAFLKPELTPPERALAKVEGWILGVPGLIEGDRVATPTALLH